METFNLTDINRVAIPLKDGLPEEYLKDYGIPESLKMHAYYGHYPMLFQEVRVGQYSLAISEYLTRNGSKLTCRANVSCLELHFLLTGKVLYNLKGLGWRGLDAGHHNLIALTDVKNETLFKITPVSTFDIHFSVEHIQQLSRRYPQLIPLTAALQKGGYASLFDLPPETTPEMFYLIVQIKEALKAGTMEYAAMIDMIGQLVIMVLENKPVKSNYKYTYTEIEKIHG